MKRNCSLPDVGLEVRVKRRYRSTEATVKAKPTSESTAKAEPWRHTSKGRPRGARRAMVSPEAARRVLQATAAVEPSKPKRARSRRPPTSFKSKQQPKVAEKTVQGTCKKLLTDTAPEKLNDSPSTNMHCCVRYNMLVMTVPGTSVVALSGVALQFSKMVPVDLTCFSRRTESSALPIFGCRRKRLPSGT